MIYHFINLIGWEKIYDAEFQENELFFADSISIKFLAEILLRKKIKRNSGPSFLAEFRKFKSPNFCIICSKKTKYTSDKNYILEADKEISEPFQYGVKISQEIKDYDYVLLGVSTPKQNLIAKGIHSQNKSQKIFTFGAIIDDLILERDIPTKIQKNGFEWFYRFFLDPKRSLTKYYQTIHSIISILLNKTKRAKFLKLSSKFYYDQNKKI